MSGRRYDAAATGDRVRSEHEHETHDHGRSSRPTYGTSDEQDDEPVTERWRESPHCTDRERKERWPVG